MLDPWIIEQIQRREEEEERRRREQRPELEIPYREPDERDSYGDRDRDDEPPASDRGVFIIDL